MGGTGHRSPVLNWDEKHRFLFFSVVLIKEYFSTSMLRHCVKSVQIRSFFWSVFSRIRTEYGEIRSMRENTDQKKPCIWTLFTQCKFWKKCQNRRYRASAIETYSLPPTMVGSKLRKLVHVI